MDLYFKRFVFSYSHGFVLNLQKGTVIGAAKEQGLAFRLPYSTGPSIGYRFLEWLDARFEVKGHRFQVREFTTDRSLFSYTTVTVGLGIYGRYRPFFHVRQPDRFPTWAQGIVASVSLRFWPKVWSSLEDDQREYDNSVTGQVEIHRANDIGIANTPLIFNVAIGYLFDITDLRAAAARRHGKKRR